MLYSMPNLGKTGQIIYVFVLYALINSVFATLMNAGDAVYLARAVRNQQNRINVMSFNGAVIMIASIALSIVMPQLLAGVGSTRAGWTTLSLSFAIPLAIIGMGRFLFIKEVAADSGSAVNTSAKKEEKFTFGESVKSLFKNQYVFIFAGMMLVTQLISNMMAANDYYCKWILGDIGMGSILSLSSILTPVVLIIFPILSKKFGTSAIVRAGAALSIAGYLIRIVGGTNMATLLLGSLLAGLGVVPITMMGSIYVIDCMAYGEWKTGIRIDGMTNSVVAFASKVGTGLASAFLGLIMGAAGYNGAADVQPDSAIAAIHFTFNWLPLLAMVILLVLSLMYTLEKKMPQVHEDLEKRHAV